MIDRYLVYDQFSTSTHTLIAGCTGSGKSVALQGIINNILLTYPRCTLYVIDPKRVDLHYLKSTYNCVSYADDTTSAYNTLQDVLRDIEHEYRRMQRKRLTTSNRVPVYLVIDELVDLMTCANKGLVRCLQRILQIGRASNTHVIACTQVILASVIPTTLQANFDTKLCLRVANKHHSRLLMDGYGCETLPRYGYGYIVKDGYTTLTKLPMYAPETTQAIIKAHRKLFHR